MPVTGDVAATDLRLLGPSFGCEPTHLRIGRHLVATKLATAIGKLWIHGSMRHGDWQTAVGCETESMVNTLFRSPGVDQQ